jgi:hypothetical protein
MLSVNQRKSGVLIVFAATKMNNTSGHSFSRKQFQYFNSNQINLVINRRFIVLSPNYDIRPSVFPTLPIKQMKNERKKTKANL